MIQTWRGPGQPFSARNNLIRKANQEEELRSLALSDRDYAAAEKHKRNAERYLELARQEDET